MNCYYHPETTSVGICSSCYRGVCQACAYCNDAGLSCNNQACITRSKSIWQIINTNAGLEDYIIDNITLPSTQKITKAESFDIVMGILFVLMGFAFYPDFIFVILFVIMGLTYVAYAIFGLLKRRKKNSKKK